MDKLYFLGEFEIISLKFIRYLRKIDEKGHKKLIFLFTESFFISFDDRKTLLENHLKELKNIKYEIINIEGVSYPLPDCKPIVDCSKKESLLIKHLNTLKSIDIPLNYLKFILEHHLFVFDKVYNMMKVKRYNHTVSVALTAYDIAQSNQIDPKKPFLAAVLHDIAKDTDKYVTKKLMFKSFKKHINETEVVYHQFIGKVFAKKLFRIHDKTILKAIEFHTTGCKNMSICAKIVYASDKIEPTRGYDSKYMIDACKSDINSGFRLVLYENVKFLEQNGVEFGVLTQEAINYYDIKSFNKK